MVFKKRLRISSTEASGANQTIDKVASTPEAASNIVGKSAVSKVSSTINKATDVTFHIWKEGGKWEGCPQNIVMWSMEKWVKEEGGLVEMN